MSQGCASGQNGLTSCQWNSMGRARLPRALLKIGVTRTTFDQRSAHVDQRNAQENEEPPGRRRMPQQQPRKKRGQPRGPGMGNHHREPGDRRRPCREKVHRVAAADLPEQRNRRLGGEDVAADHPQLMANVSSTNTAKAEEGTGNRWPGLQAGRADMIPFPRSCSAVQIMRPDSSRNRGQIADIDELPGRALNTHGQQIRVAHFRKPQNPEAARLPTSCRLTVICRA